jgi:hypothetical protein
VRRGSERCEADRDTSHAIYARILLNGVIGASPLSSLKIG